MVVKDKLVEHHHVKAAERLLKLHDMIAKLEEEYVLKMTNKVNAGRFFEDFTLNEVIQHATPRTITAGDCIVIYRAYTAVATHYIAASPLRNV